VGVRTKSEISGKSNPGKGTIVNRNHTEKFHFCIEPANQPAGTRTLCRATLIAAIFVSVLMSAKTVAAQVTITQQPQNATVVAGQAATFTVTASAVCRSVWFKNGAQITYGSMAKTVSYTTPATTAAMSGAKYSVLLYGCVGASGKVLSQPAVLSVTQSQTSTQTGPSITSQPSSETVTAGQAATFTVAATGSTPLAYQWKKNGAVISGATSSSYTTPATSTSDSGSTFAVVVGNSVGSTTSNTATLTVSSVSTSPSITKQPASQTVIAGQTATTTVAATGTAPLSYQWFKNGAAISGATSSTYTTPATTTADSGDIFQASVANSVGSVTSNSATLTVDAASGPTVAINSTNVHQTIEGFGAAVAFQGGNPWTNEEADLLFCNSVSSPCAQAGAGLSLVRCQIEPDGTFPYVNQMREAIARGARAWCTPWTAPASYKSNGSLDNGGYLLAGDYQNWANYLSNYVATLKNTYGIPLYAVSVQNEPDFSASYQSMLYTSQNFHDFIVNLGPTFAAKNPGVKLIMPEESHWQFGLAGATIADPTTTAYVNIYAAHGYGNTSPTAPSLPPGAELWQTEDSDLYPPNDPSMSNALGWAVAMHNYLTVANINAWVWWWGVDSSECTGQGLINDSNSGSPCVGTVVAKRLWTTGNFSRFVRPGWVRVDASANPVSGVYVSAYKDPSTGNFAIVVVNQSTANQTLNFTGIAGSSVTPWVTSASLNLASQTAIPVSQGSLSANVAASSVTTFVGP